VKLTKTAVDALPTPATPKGRKVFIVLYRAGGAGSRLRKYTIGPYGRVTLHQARAAALKIFPARAEGRDPAAEKQQARRRLVADRLWHGSTWCRAACRRQNPQPSRWNDLGRRCRVSAS
jgi:hypothetical protein